MDIIVVFCKAHSDHVIDVLVRATYSDTQQMYREEHLDYVQENVINRLITICAQPTGIQGVKLIESVIWPDCLHDPSRPQDREDQCVEITYLKKQLKRNLKRGEQDSKYDWKQTRHMPHPLSNDLIDLLGLEYYGEVLEAYKKWFDVKVRGSLLEIDNKVDEFGKYQSSQNVIITSSENDLKNGLDQEEQLRSEEAIEVQSTNLMVRSILSLHRKVDATHGEVLKLNDKMDQMANRLDEIHKELQCMRKDVISKLDKSIGKLLKMALENEVEKQLPRVALLTSKLPESIFEKLLTRVSRVSGVEIVRIQLYCEDKKLPHPVENQLGITLTSLSESHSEYLDKALPYINGFFHVLTVAARLGIFSMVPFASSLIPNWTPHLKLAKQYPIIQSHYDSKKDHIFLSKLECASIEWQKCLASILRKNGGLTDQNIDKKFHLKRTIYDEVDGSTQVAWLCKLHCEGKRSFPLG